MEEGGAWSRGRDSGSREEVQRFESPSRRRCKRIVGPGLPFAHISFFMFFLIRKTISFPIIAFIRTRLRLLHDINYMTTELESNSGECESNHSSDIVCRTILQI